MMCITKEAIPSIVGEVNCDLANEIDEFSFKQYMQRLCILNSKVMADGTLILFLGDWLHVLQFHLITSNYIKTFLI